MRYYLHGDEKEEQPGIYYCRACDAFVSRNHFYEDCSEENDFKRYKRTLKIWNELKKSGTHYTRPKDAKNIFK